MSMNKPLLGTKCVSLTLAGAGPTASRMLADWGCDVVKVEALSGDIGRNSGAYFGLVANDEENAHFEFLNAGTRSLCIDLKTPEGRAVMDRLLAESNIFVSNMRLKALKNMGLDYESLSVKHPHLIWGHLDGFGSVGPEADSPGFDNVAFWARSGALLDFAEKNTAPLVAPSGVGDFAVGATLAGGVAAALYKQAKTGKGEKVMISLYGQSIWTLSILLQGIGMAGAEYPKSRKETGTPLANTYKCSDGEWVFIQVMDYDRQYSALCKALGREDLIKDPRFDTLDGVKKNNKEMIAILEETVGKFTLQAVMEQLKAFDIPHTKVNHVKDIITDPQALANNYIYYANARNGKRMLMAAPPIKYGTIDAPEHRSAPLLGEHSVEVLKELRYSDDEVKAFIEKKIVKAR